MKQIRLFLIVLSAVLAINSSAGTPISIKYVEEIIINGNNIYAHYKVTCSDGKTADISGWNDGKKWCIGKGRQDRCAKKRIQIAKKVCGKSK